MKIAHIGNLCNTGYLHCLYLRRKGIDAHLYIHEIEELPNEKDQSYDPNSNSWVHRYGGKGNYILRKVKSAPLLYELSKYDLVHSWTASLNVWAERFLRLQRKPYIAYATGSDLREEAQRNTKNGRRIANHFKHAALVAHTFDRISKEVD